MAISSFDSTLPESLFPSSHHGVSHSRRVAYRQPLLTVTHVAKSRGRDEGAVRESMGGSLREISVEAFDRPYVHRFLLPRTTDLSIIHLFADFAVHIRY